MGLDMYLSKLNKKVNNMKEFENCMDIITKVYEKTRLTELIEDFLNLSVEDFLTKNKLIILYNRYIQSSNNNSASKEFEVELSNYIKDVKRTLESINTIDTNLTSTQLCYWRKHEDLNMLFKNMYYNKGGKGEFNCEYLLLSRDDIESIIEQYKNLLYNEHGYIGWRIRTGYITTEELEDSLYILKDVLEEIDWNNETVYYSCWW